MSGASIYGTGFGGDGADQRNEETETLTTYKAPESILKSPLVWLAFAGLALWFFTKKKG